MKKILIADDEPTLVSTLQYNLEREGYSVVIATDGEAAVAAARERHPDLIVLDIMMPRLNGLEVCRILRREMHVPIVILSARGDERDRAAGVEAGADDYVTKPFSMGELIARIGVLLLRSECLPPPDK
ncbi:MAG: response regulator transcription factor [Chloroflexi bacterium]|nr:MAG: response regulator transcription factor [Chloroflexota bacterium]